jgi:hypothetical protein
MYKISGVHMFQIKQNRDLSIEVSVVPRAGFGGLQIEEILEGIRDRVNGVKVSVNVVDEILRNEKTGKIRCILNENKQ